jgi:hypothetical protein
MIWPNRFSGGNGFIQAGRALRLPGAADPFAFRLQPPYGTEFLKAIASTLPFNAALADFADLGTDYRRTATRGLAVTGTGAPGTIQSEIAEALASYYIGP